VGWVVKLLVGEGRGYGRLGCDHDKAKRGQWWSQKPRLRPRKSKKQEMVVSKTPVETTIKQKAGNGGLKSPG